VPPSELNSVLKGLKAAKPWRLVTLDAASARELVADVRSGATSVGVELSVDSRGLISGLFLQPSPALPKAPTTWAALDRQVRSLAPRVGFEAAELTADGRCRALSSVAPTTARPLASMFKLYVLATVARQVAAGRLSWARRVALASQLRSLPSGLLQVEPPAPGSPSAS
jgi:beta-lactamase class A